MKNFLRNFFVPHQENNYKARILHHSTLILVIFFLIISTFLLNSLNKVHPEVLGISANITNEELLTLLNDKRKENNLSSLSLNPELSAAALNKANDMIAKNYWAHSSPEGKSPWDFIKEAGYTYIYAGENLARGYNTSSDVTNAWMVSPSHKENMMSSNYSDVGFAAVVGNLDGQETVLVVEIFGNRNLAALPQDQNIQLQQIQEEAAEEKQGAEKPETQKPGGENPISRQKILVAPAQIKNKPLIDSIFLTKNLSLFLISVVVFSLILEMVILERKKIFSFARHNPDHVLFLISVVLLIFILGRGVIL